MLEKNLTPNVERLLVVLNGKKLPNDSNDTDFKWERKDEHMHIIKLEIKYEDFSNEFPMFVNGALITVEKEIIEKEIENDIVRKLNRNNGSKSGENRTRR